MKAVGKSPAAFSCLQSERERAYGRMDILFFSGIINCIRPVSKEDIQFLLRFPQDRKIILNPYDKMAFN